MNIEELLYYFELSNKFSLKQLKKSYYIKLESLEKSNLSNIDIKYYTSILQQNYNYLYNHYFSNENELFINFTEY